MQRRPPLLVVVTPPVNKKKDWARTFEEAVTAPFGATMIILFSFVLGGSLNILFPRSDSQSALIGASNPAAAASTTPTSVPPPPTTTAAAASTALVSMPPRPNSTGAAPDRDEVAAQLARGRAALAIGDLAGARLIFRWAAEQDDLQAALALGETYDPAALKRLGIIKFADLAQAREWYRRAADLGSAAATSRLEQLSKIDRLSVEN